MLTHLVSTTIGLVVLLALSASFSGAETALFSLTRDDLRALSTPRGRFVRALLRDPRSLLITILLGNLVVNTLFYALAALLAISVHRAGYPIAGAGIGVGAPLAIIVLGEVWPKTLAVRFPRPIAEVIAPPLMLLRSAVWPVRVTLGAFSDVVLRLFVRPSAARAGPFVTADELKQLLELGESHEALRPEEGRMLRGLLDLGHLRCREVMVPRVDVAMCPVNATIDVFLALVRTTGRKLIPVYEDSPDRVLGVVDVRRVLAFQPATLRECLRPVAFVPESKSVESLLREFRQTHTALAIVVDEYGGTEGLVTLEDLLEEIVGEIGPEPGAPHLPSEISDLKSPKGLVSAEGGPSETSDVTSQMALVRRTGVHTYLVAGRLPIREWNEHPAFVDLARRGTDTIGGFVMTLLGRLPRPGDVATYRNLRFTVETVVRRRIGWLTVEVLHRAGRWHP